MKRKINPELEIEGILFTMYRNRFRLTKTVEELVCNTYKQAVRIYNTKIPYSIRSGEAVIYKQSVMEYADRNNVAIAYQNLTQEELKNGNAE